MHDYPVYGLSHSISKYSSDMGMSRNRNGAEKNKKIGNERLHGQIEHLDYLNAIFGTNSD